VGLYNLNFEYHVFNPWLDKLSTILNPTPHTDSITRATLANAESLVLPGALPPPAQLNVTLSDCTVGLNPLDLPSRGLLLITATTIRGEWDFRDGGRGKFDVSLNRAHLFVIDDTANLLVAPRPRVRSSGRKEVMGYFTVQLLVCGGEADGRNWGMRCARRCRRGMRLFGFYWWKGGLRLMLMMSVFNSIRVPIPHRHLGICLTVLSLRSKLTRGIAFVIE
jgi:Autophagy-related protein 2 CAD motif